jgi:hypothetical protein
MFAFGIVRRAYGVRLVSHQRQGIIGKAAIA